MDTPNYYAILPASVRYDEKITPFAKILYAEVTALSNKQGFCSASNKYFADLYKCSERSISENIALLVQGLHLRSEVERSYRRRLYPLAQIFQGDRTKVLGGDRTKVLKNNTSTNTKSNKEGITLSEITEEKEKRLSYKEMMGYATDRVKPIRVWAEGLLARKYPNQIGQETAISKCLKVGYSEEDIKNCFLSLYESDFWSEKGFDFTTVAKEISKAKGKKKVSVVQNKYSKYA